MFSNQPFQELNHLRSRGLSFPSYQVNQEPAVSIITTKTLSYIFALNIDSVTLHHNDGPHSSALQYEATILQELDKMTPDDFRGELRDSLTSFYEDVLKFPGAGGRPQPKIIKHRFAAKPATGVQATGTDSYSAPVPASSWTGSDSRVPTRSLRLRWLRCRPRRPNPRHHPAAAKSGKGVKASGKGGR